MVPEQKTAIVTRLDAVHAYVVSALAVIGPWPDARLLHARTSLRLAKANLANLRDELLSEIPT